MFDNDSTSGPNKINMTSNDLTEFEREDILKDKLPFSDLESRKEKVFPPPL